MNKLYLSLKMQFRIPISIFFSFAFPIIMMITMIVSYGNFSIGNGYHFIDKYFLISISVGLLPIAFISFPIWICETIQENTLKRLKYLGVNIKRMILADIGSYAILAMISVSLNLIFGKLIFHLNTPSFFVLSVFLIQIFYCVCGLLLTGALIALIVKNTKVILPLGMTLLFFTYMMIGTFIQFKDLPNVLQNIGNLIPIKYLTNDFFNIWTGNALLNIKFLILNTLYSLIIGGLSLIIYKVKIQKG